MPEEQEFPEKNKENCSGFSAYLENNNAYRSLFKGSNAVMLLIDPETSDIVDANLAACDFYGWSCEALRNKKIHMINTLSPENVKAEMKNAVEEKRNYFFFNPVESLSLNCSERK